MSGSRSPNRFKFGPLRNSIFIKMSKIVRQSGLVDSNSTPVSHPKKRNAGQAVAGIYKPNSTRPWRDHPSRPIHTQNRIGSAVDLRYRNANDPMTKAEKAMKPITPESDACSK